MPRLNNHARDEEPGYDHTPGFAGGQVSYARRNLLQPMESPRLRNVMLHETGPATTRRGAEQLHTAATSGANPILGLAYFDTPSLEQLVRVINSTVQTHDGVAASAWATAAGFAPNATARMAIVQGLDALYLTNGVDNMRSWNGAAFTDMGTGSPNPPLATILIWGTNRLIATGVASAPDTVYFSDILGPGVWNYASQSLRVGAGDGDPIIGAVLWTENLLVVLKRSSVWLIDITPASGGSAIAVANMPIRRVSAVHGCAAARSVAQVGSDVWFLADDLQIRSVQRILEGADTAVSPPVSRPVADELEAINRAAADKAAAVFYGSRYLLAFPGGSATQPDRVLAFNAAAGVQRWEGLWTGWTPTCWARSYFSGQTRLNFGRADGLVWRWRDVTAAAGEAADDFVDAGSAIATAIDTRAHTWGESLNPKRAQHVEIEFNNSRAPAVDLYLIRDDAVDADPLATVTSGLGGVSFPLTLPLTFGVGGVARVAVNLLHKTPAREWGLRISAAAQKVSVRAVQFAGFIEPMQTVAPAAFSGVPR